MSIIPDDPRHKNRTEILLEEILKELEKNNNLLSLMLDIEPDDEDSTDAG